MTDPKEKTVARLRHMAYYLKDEDLDLIVGLILTDLGFRANKVSFLYLKTAIMRFYDDPSQLLTYGVYQDVAKIFGRNTSRYQVEVAIRRAIKQAWVDRDPETWNSYYPLCVTTRPGGPSNMEFLLGMAAVLDLWNICKKVMEGGVHHGS